MASRNLRLGKQRTRQHVIADLSVNYVERFILEEGHTCQRLGSDYGYDLLMSTFDEQGIAEPGSIYFQMKASEILQESHGDYVYDLDIRDHNLWIREKMPVIFVLYDASRKRAYWLAVQQYFNAGTFQRLKRGVKHIRIRVPKSQAVNRRSITMMRKLKQAAIELESE